MTQPGNANLMVVPGSHKSGQPPSHADFERIGRFPGAVQVCAPAGSAILFHNALWHTAAPFASPQHHRTMLYYAYEHPWMMSCEETWHYSKDFYNHRLSPAQHRFFHGNFFDPPEHRQQWG
jgi:ectoine hydroxylase-related dioxygenase (phytanoyl-CoA dioxygenase family)